MQGKELDFFLGAIAPAGFCSYCARALPDVQDGTVILLKAGPGCGASALLRHIARTLTSEGETVELIHCAGGPASLDGVLCKARQLAAFDASAPHALEPAYPGAFEDVVCLYGDTDRALLQRSRAQIVELSRQYELHMQRASRYITAAGSLLQDSARAALCCTDCAKVRAFARALSRRYLPALDTAGREDVRLLSALTPDGLVVCTDTVRSLADTVVVLDDEYGAASRVLLQELRALALEKGQHTVTCYCSLSPYEKIDHLIFPAARVAFVTGNSRHPMRFAGQRTIHCARFAHKDGIRLRRKRLRFNRKAAAELLEQTVRILREAKALRDALETLYRQAIAPGALEGAATHLSQLLAQCPPRR